MFIDPHWQESLSALLVAINMAYGAPNLAVKLQAFSKDDVVLIAQTLQSRSYAPERWFGRSGTPPAEWPSLSMASLDVQRTNRYTVLAFAAELSGRESVSSRSGGLLYEDPFYAVLAAYNVGLATAKGVAPTRGALVEVKTPGREQAWARRQTIIDHIHRGTYRPEAYFAVSGSFLAQTPQSLWHCGEVSGDDLAHLIFNGQAGATFGDNPPKFHGLYKYVQP